MINCHFGFKEKIKEGAILIEAVISAGDTIRALSNKNHVKFQKKGDNSLLTDADIQANQILKEQLLHNFPKYGWLSEETNDRMIRLGKKRTWVVDPLDGTKEYINKIAEYAISAALVENGAPILAAVFNPATNELFYAAEGQGAWMNDKQIFCTQTCNKKIKILASRSEVAKGDWQCFMEHFNVSPMGSIAYKLALVAAGKADATFSFEPRSEWDIAAGVLLVQESGGIVHDLSGRPFMFNQKNTRVNGVIASSKIVYCDVMKKIESKLAPQS